MQAFLFLMVLFIMAACLLYLASEKSAAENKIAQKKLANNIDRLLPQTQCRACGYAGCLPYARAIAAGRADINQCSPGGQSTIAAIAALTGQAAKALNPAHALVRPGQTARIDEALCIGCVKCIHACPVDAIIGAPKQMHSVIAAACTGCALCLPPCPVDCIRLVAADDGHTHRQWLKPGQAVGIRL